MPWPQTVDYNAAIQHPSACFADADLARGQPAEGMIPGIPLSYAGSFATVYKLLSPSGPAWAVKCFTRKVENLQQRYKEISEHLQRRKRRFVVDFQYLCEGIKVEGVWYPAVKMQWVEGFTLNEFLRFRVGNSAILEQLCQLWLRLAHDMREDHLAHGDLQHGNVMLVPGSSAMSMLLRLVDYDGMWVPSLADLPPGEVGHANYQHPQRLADGGYSAQIDRFAHLAIYTALRCLIAGGKALWSAFDNEENLLFREADFRAPAQSKLFVKLLSLPDTEAAALAGHLLLASQGPLDQVPFLSDLLPDRAVVPLSTEQIDRLGAIVGKMALTVPPPAVTSGLSPVPDVPAPVDWFLPEAGSNLQPSSAAEQPTRLEMPTVAEMSAFGQGAGSIRDHRGAAEELYVHARAIIRRGDPSYALQLLLSSCKLDPGCIEHRALLRLTARATATGKQSSWLESLGNRAARNQLISSHGAGEHRKVLEYGEELLLRLPSDVSVQLTMAKSAEALDEYALAMWLLEEARRASPRNKTIPKALSRLAKRLEYLGKDEEVAEQLHRSETAERKSQIQHGSDPGADTPGAQFLALESSLPPLEANIVCDRPDPVVATAEQRQGAASLFERAGEVTRNGGDPEYAQQLLLTCCKLDPANIEHRRTLREVGRMVAGGNRGGWLASLGNLSARSRLRSARHAGDYRKILEHGEELLTRRPGDVPTQLDMASAAEALGWHTLAVWLLKEAREQAPNDLRVLRALARLCERLERFSAAAAIWKYILRADPGDTEAVGKIKNLSADAAIARAASLV